MGLVKNSSGCGGEELFTSGEEWVNFQSLITSVFDATRSEFQFHINVDASDRLRFDELAINDLYQGICDYSWTLGRKTKPDVCATN
jgi:hypothetical protein